MRVRYIAALAAALCLHAGTAWANPIDDRISQPRNPGTPMGAIGMVVDLSEGGESRGTGFLVSPCHVLTAAHAVENDTAPISAEATVAFFVGQGDLGPGFGAAMRPFAKHSLAHPVVWGALKHKKLEPGHYSSAPEVYREGFDDWALLKLDRCLGEDGYRYLNLLPITTSTLTRSGGNRPTSIAGLPVDHPTNELFMDPACTLFGQVGYEGWDMDCIAVPGNSGGPILAREPDAGETWPRVLGIVVRGDRTLSTETRDARSPRYLETLSGVVPVSAFIADIAPYLPKDPLIDTYLAANLQPDRGYGQPTAEVAIDDLTAALSANPHSAMLLTRRGWWQARASESEAAIADYTAALQEDPGFMPALRARALERTDQLRSNERPPERVAAALADLDQLLRLSGDDAELHEARGRILYDGYDYRAALEDFGAALDADPAHASLRRKRAGMRMELGDRKGAEIDYDLAVMSYLSGPDSLVERAAYRQRIGDLDGAFTDVDTALANAPGYYDALFRRAMLYVDRGDIDSAQRLLTAAGESDARYVHLRGFVRHINGDLTGAITDYSQDLAPRRDPFDVDGAYQVRPTVRARDPLLAYLAVMEAGARDTANAGLRRVAHRMPAGNWTERLVRCLLGEYSETDLEKAAAMGPEVLRKYQEFDLHFYLGAQAMLNGDRRKARSYLEQVVATDMRQTVEFHLARRYLQDLGGPAYLVRN